MIENVVRTREEGHMLRRTLDAPVVGKRRRGRQKTRWKDYCNRHMESVGLKEEDILDQDTREERCKTILAMSDDGKSPRRRREEEGTLLIYRRYYVSMDYALQPAFYDKPSQVMLADDIVQMSSVDETWREEWLSLCLISTCLACLHHVECMLSGMCMLTEALALEPSTLTLVCPQ